MIFFCQFKLFSQTLPIFSCSYNQQKTESIPCLINSNENIDNNEAVTIIDKILQPIGLRRNFVILSCSNIQNALAVTTNLGIRYIIYDYNFLSTLSELTSDWTKISILAHEIGHHLSGHTLSASESLDGQRKKELEADEFSGFILFKLGASLRQAQAAVNILATEEDDANLTHPSKSKRILAIEKGYKNAEKNEKLFDVKKGDSPEYYFSKAYKLTNEEKYDEAFNNYTTAITLNPNYAEAYVNRGQVKMMYAFQDKETIINDFNIAIRIDPNLGKAYFFRGVMKKFKNEYLSALEDFKTAVMHDRTLLHDKNYLLERAFVESILSNNSSKEKETHYQYFKTGFDKLQSGQYKDAIEYCNKAINLKPKEPLYYDVRGVARMNLEDYESAIKDFDVALQLNPNADLGYYHRGLSYQYSQNYAKALADFNVALIIKPGNIEYKSHRAFNRRMMTDYEGAIKDYNDLIALAPNNDTALLERAINYLELKKYELAITDLNKAITINPSSFYHFFYRGRVKLAMKDKSGACDDFKMGCRLGGNFSCEKYRDICK